MSKPLYRANLGPPADRRPKTRTTCDSTAVFQSGLHSHTSRGTVKIIPQCQSKCYSLGGPLIPPGRNSRRNNIHDIRPVIC